MAENLEARISLAVEAGNAAQNIGDIRKQIKELQNIAISAGESNVDAFNKASEEAGKLRDRINDAKDAVSGFSGKPINDLSRGFGGLKNKLLDLDFQGFNQQVGRLNVLSKQVTFKELSKSVVDTGKSFANLGKILLTNPLFLLATAVLLIITNFQKLTESGGILGTMFSAIGDTISFVIDKLKMISDWLGLTDFAGQEKAENTLKNAEKEQQAIEDRYNAEIAIAKASGQDVTDIELKKQEEIRASVQLQIDQLNYLKKSQGKLSEDQKKQLDELNRAYQKSLTDTAVITANAEREANEKIQQEREKLEQERKKAFEKRKADIISLNSEISKIEENQYQESLDQFDKQARQIDLKYEELIRKAEKLGQDTSKIREFWNNEIIALNKKQAEAEKKIQDEEAAQKLKDEQEREEQIFNARLQAFGTREEIEIQAILDKYDKLFEVLELSGEEEKALIEKQQEEISGIYKKYRDAEEQEMIVNQQKIVDAQNQLNQARVVAVMAGFDLLNAVYSNNKKVQDALFIAQRGFEASQVAINGIKNAAILKGQIAAAAPLLSNPVTAGPASATIAAATKGLVSNTLTTAAGIASILATTIGRFSKPDSTAPTLPSSTSPRDSGGGGAAPTFTPPQFFGLGSGILQGQGGQTQTQQVVVLENDITNTQNRVRVIENRATIG